MITPQLLQDPRCTSTLPFASTLCGACADVCPVKIDIPRILAELRSRFAMDPSWGPVPRAEQGLFRLAGTVLSHRCLYEGVGRVARILYPLIRRLGFTNPFPPPAARPYRWSRKQGRPEARKDRRHG